jgi:transposase
MAMPWGQVQTLALDHLGVVAAVVRELGLVEKIDRRLPVTDRAKVSMGQRALALILNGLGFSRDRLYLVPRFFHNKPVERLIGPGVRAEDLNDDALGRALDEIAQYGTTRLFAELAYEVGTEQGLLGRFARLDTTSLMVYGEYGEAASPAEGEPRVQERPGEPGAGPRLTFGYSKDHRADLKQLVLSLTMTGEASLPMWFEALDGNRTDCASFHETRARVAAFRQQLAEAPALIWVADSALYAVDELLARPELPWVTRVPHTVGAAKALCEAPPEWFDWCELGEGYRMAVMGATHGGLRQRWCLVESEQARAREHKTFERRLARQEEALDKALGALQRRVFGCVADAEQVLEALRKPYRYHLIEARVESVCQYTRRGRPKTGEVPEVVGYRLSLHWQRNAQALAPAYYALGRFILATNVLDEQVLCDAEVLTEYKKQSEVERGFRFLKDPWFMADAVFLKTPRRIEALMMVMTLCLMVYNVGQHWLRQRLTARGQTLPSQVGKPTAKPTLRWVFQLMEGVHVVRLGLEQTQATLQEHVSNLDAVKQSIIRLFGMHAQAIYGVT